MGLGCHEDWSRKHVLGTCHRIGKCADSPCTDLGGGDLGIRD